MKTWTLSISMALFLALSAEPPSAQPRPLPPDHPLEQHRRGVKVTHSPAQGRVVAVDEGRLLTDLTMAGLAAQGIHDGDQIRIRLKGTTLEARLLALENYRELMSDAAAVETLDVDVVAVADDVGVTLIGLSAALADWTGARTGAVVLVEGR
jgi:hypothetical protein